MTYVREVLEKHIDEVFRECQERRHIESGDITSHDTLVLDYLMDLLEKHITRVLDFETPSYNMCTALEVLEDYHVFKKGEVVYCDESSEEYYWIVKKNIKYGVPHEKCRVID